MPRTSHGAAQHSIGLLVIDKFLLLWVPSELAAQADSDIIKVANGVGANSRFNEADRPLPALDAIPPRPSLRCPKTVSPAHCAARIVLPASVYLHRSGVVCSVAPLGDIHMVDSPGTTQPAQ